MTHKGIIGIVFVAGIIVMGVYSATTLMEQKPTDHEKPVVDEIKVADDVNVSKGNKYHIVLDDGLIGKDI